MSKGIGLLCRSEDKSYGNLRLMTKPLNKNLVEIMSKGMGLHTM